MVKKKIDPLVVIIDSIIGYFIFLVFIGNLFQVITDPLIKQNIRVIATTSIFFVIAWWIFAVFFKKQSSLF